MLGADRPPKFLRRGVGQPRPFGGRLCHHARGRCRISDAELLIYRSCLSNRDSDAALRLRPPPQGGHVSRPGLAASRSIDIIEFLALFPERGFTLSEIVRSTGIN